LADRARLPDLLAGQQLLLVMAVTVVIGWHATWSARCLGSVLFTNGGCRSGCCTAAGSKLSCKRPQLPVDLQPVMVGK
jgi:hypothetical protein